MASRKPRPIARTEPAVAEPEGILGDVDSDAAALGELFRKAALGLTAALIVSRAFWPPEFSSEADSGTGLLWSFLMLVAAMIGVMSMWLQGGLRLRRSWADLGVVTLFVLVGFSATHAPERRLAINLAWEWFAVGVGYLLLRNLPRTRGETSALAGALVLTAIAVAAYGLYQVAVEFPRDRAFFLSNPRESMARAGFEANPTPQAINGFRDRLVGSREPVSTFALTNSLAGFLVGPCAIVLVMGLRGLARKDMRRASIWAAPLGLILIVTLMITKSRSAYLGLLVAMLALAWSERNRVSMKRIVLVGLGVTIATGVLVTVGVLTRQLDRQVITESFKSLSYRAEYWQGAWGVITEGPTRWLVGLGPGNFAGPYLRYKLPRSSETILDPHNMFLEVWAVAGIGALIALVAGLGLGLRECFAKSSLPDDEAPTASTTASSPWLIVAAGLGGWILVVLLGRLSPFEPDPTGRRMNLGLSPRWLILGVSWFVAAALGRSFWKRASVSSEVLGFGALAIMVNLLAAGGIGFASVSLMLWGLLALGQDLRSDRRSGVPTEVGGRVVAFLPAAILAALMGTFLGTAVPFWNAESAIAIARAERSGPRPNLERSAEFFRRAAHADPLGSRAWLGWADLEFESWWRARDKPYDFTWHRIDSMLRNALKRPRNPNSLPVHRLRAALAKAFLTADLPPAERFRVRSDRLNSAYAAGALYPTDATIRADLAEALADLDKFTEAVVEGELARVLDSATPHIDKKMLPEVRMRLNEELPRWRVRKRR